jgi:hypothetical protein
MPRIAMDYSKTIIYKIQHEDNEEISICRAYDRLHKEKKLS